ncbi:methyl-accepting chemotaxis protein [Massilia sp. PWRC2]|uniref:methyl-accepting chemotaxis protein n=1 Tax=Massilia sp. PWRC2 TaxID=2804626 RepID=UPI003CF3095B
MSVPLPLPLLMSVLVRLRRQGGTGRAIDLLRPLLRRPLARLRAMRTGAAAIAPFATAATIATIAAPLLLIAGLLLPPAWLGGIDRLLGRPGGTLLLMALLLLVLAAVRAVRALVLAAPAPLAVAPAAAAAAPLVAILAGHDALDLAIGERLDGINVDTERAALAIVSNIRQLYDSAEKVVRYLDSSGMQADQLGREINDSVRYLVEIGGFIGAMPPKLERDLRNVASVIEEIGAMSALVEGVHAISRQSHMLSINAAIEASRAGPAGVTFAVVARQMRTLAADSEAVASRIHDGLARARLVVEGGMAVGLAESSAQMGQVTRAVASIEKLKDNFEDMSQYYKTRFAVVSKHNEGLAGDISAALGQIQHQDVVRQTIERIQRALARRRALQRELDGDGATLPARLALLTRDYLDEEQRHCMPSAAGADDPPAFELF